MFINLMKFVTGLNVQRPEVYKDMEAFAARKVDVYIGFLYFQFVNKEVDKLYCVGLAYCGVAFIVKVKI
ncbi:hypothetical protein D3C73_1599950 [compost metagenome]